MRRNPFRKVTIQQKKRRINVVAYDLYGSPSVREFMCYGVNSRQLGQEAVDLIQHAINSDHRP
jgi:hypothetical protein